jgi:hypothetical protein
MWCDTSIIPATQEAQIGTWRFEANPGNKGGENPSQSISQVWWCMPGNPPCRKLGSGCEPSPGQKLKKITKARGMSQMVKCLPSKCKTLNSNSTALKYKRKRKKKSILHVLIMLPYFLDFLCNFPLWIWVFAY